MSAAYPNQPSFGPSPYPQPQRKSGLSWLVGLLLIGLGILFLGGIVCVTGVCYVASNLDKWVVGFGREAVVAGINESELPDGEKVEVIAQVDRLVNAYKERKINQADLDRVFTQLQDSPAMKALTLYGIEDEFLTDTKLTPAEVEQGRRTFQRALRAVYEGKITDEDFYAVLPDEQGEQVRLASTNSAESSDDDLRLALVKLKVIADNGSIPDEPFQLDIGDEVKKLVDRALAGK